MGCCGQSVGNPGTGNGLIGDPNKYIQFSGDKLVVNDGPNQVFKINLCDFKIPLENYFATTITVPPGATNVPLQYCGALGNQITYLWIQPEYSSENKIPEDNYMEYFFKPNPEVVRYFGPMLVLSGTEKVPVPEVLVNNPHPKYSVNLTILAATTNVSMSTGGTIVGDTFSLTDMKWTDILSDPVSKDLIIYKNNAPAAYIELAKISNIEVDGKFITIDDTAIGEIVIKFVDDFNANQANSAITWVMKDPERNMLTPSTQADTTPPEVTYADTFTTEIILNLEGTNSTGGFNTMITKQDIIDLWIESVIDNRDGEIILDDTNITIIEIETGNEINAITRHGKYEVTITVRDVAQNAFVDSYVINVKDTKAAKMIVQQWVTNTVKMIAAQPDIYLQDYSADTLNEQDLIDLTLSSVIDERDGNIPLNTRSIRVEMTLNNVVYNVIDTPGTWVLRYFVVDSDNNVSQSLYENENQILTNHLNTEVNELVLEIKENQEPVVTWRNEPEPYELGLFQFNVNGIINKNDLYNYLIIDVSDDRTPQNEIYLIDSKIIQTHTYDSNSDQYIPTSPVELFYIHEKGIYTYQVQHIDNDATINTDQKSVKIL